jgi:hypothetical protein
VTEGGAEPGGRVRSAAWVDFGQGTSSKVQAFHVGSKASITGRRAGPIARGQIHAFGSRYFHRWHPSPPLMPHPPQRIQSEPDMSPLLDLPPVTGLNPYVSAGWCQSGAMLAAALHGKPQGPREMKWPDRS